MKELRVLAVFGQFDHGDDNGPRGYSICAEAEGRRHHFYLVDESRFGGDITLSRKGECDGSCRHVPSEVLSALQTIPRSSTHEPVFITP